MGVELLDKTRKINQLLHNNHKSKVVFNDICEVLTEILTSNVLVISKKGKVLGASINPGTDEIRDLITTEVGEYIDDMLNERLLGILSTKENVNLQTLGFEELGIENFSAIITPIDIAGERLGTIFFYRDNIRYSSLPGLAWQLFLHQNLWIYIYNNHQKGFLFLLFCFWEDKKYQKSIFF